MTDPSVSLLRRAAERHTKRPCRGVFARDSDGASVPPESPCAMYWCAVGAVRAERPVFVQRTVAVNFLDGAAKVYGLFDSAEVNDHREDLMPDVWSEADEAQPLHGQALIDARVYEARRLGMIARGEQ